MKIIFTPDAWEDYILWQKDDKQILRRINELIKDCIHTPYSGIGKPEPLRHELTGLWSRRITHEHRLVYQHNNDSLIIISVRYHYQK